MTWLKAGSWLPKLSGKSQGMISGINASYLSISNGIGPLLAATFVDQKGIATAEKTVQETGLVESYATYAYPIYVAGVCSFITLLWAIRSRGLSSNGTKK
jgi:hypothetical protein